MKLCTTSGVTAISRIYVTFSIEMVNFIDLTKIQEVSSEN